MMKYILDGHEVKAVADVIAWAQWYETADRRVAGDKIGPYFVSTVFLGLDHAFGLSTVPIVFETMVFADDDECLCRRYATWDEAEQGHQHVTDGLRVGRTLADIESDLGERG